MREIKFRAWDKKRNMYGEVLSLERAYSDLAPDFMGHDGRVQLFNIANEADCAFWGTWIENVKLEQYINRKDKNNQEIYEGDIIKGRISTHLGINTGDVYNFIVTEWISDFGLCFYFQPIKGILKTFESPISSVVEIIGNIHENPELLK